MSDSPIIPDHLRMSKLRKRLLLSEKPQYIIAAEIGIHPATLSQYSLRRVPIATHHIPKLTRYFKCQPEDIVGVLNERDLINWVIESKETA